MEFSKAEIYAVLGSLVSVIGVLWALVVKWMNHNQKKLKECEDHHKESQSEIVRLTGDMNYLKGQVDGISKLSKSVLDKLDELSNKD